MNIELTGRHLEITQPLREHLESRFDKLRQFFDERESAAAHVVLSVEKTRQQAEIIITWREHTLTAKETDKDLYQAIVKAVDKLEKQTRRLKDKAVKRQHTAAKIGIVAPEPEGEIPIEPLPPRIINVQPNDLKPMSIEEAVLLIKQQNSQFTVFRSVEAEQICVLYKRSDGNFGLITA